MLLKHPPCMRNRRIQILCCFHHNLSWLQRLRLFRSFRRKFLNFIRLFWNLNFQRILSRFDRWLQLKVFLLEVFFHLKVCCLLFYFLIKVFFLLQVFLRKVLFLFWLIFLWSLLDHKFQHCFLILRPCSLLLQL